ncbi:MAG: RNA-binding protein [Paracoccaceae bacterium]|nr:RNA-binding protein [Paracoccaceae bacterium]
MTRGGRKKQQTEPERRCIVTGATGPCAGMIRFVVGPEGEITPDIAGNLPGRGIWVTSRRQILQKAMDKRLFARAARQAVVIPDDLVVRTETLLARRVVSLLSLARKSGQAIAGFEKVKEAITSGAADVLLQACDGSEGQKRKIRPPKGENSLVSCLSGRELGLAFGRENVIHAALAAGGLCDRIVEEASRLAGFRQIGALGKADASGTGPEQEGVKDV